MLYLVFFRKSLIKKKSFKLKIHKFFAINNFFLQKPVFQAPAFALTTFSYIIKFLSIIFICFLSCIIFKNIFLIKLGNKNFYIASINKMRLRLAKLQESDKEV